MSTQTPDNSSDAKHNWSVMTLDFDAKQNLFGAFVLLTKIDRRVNPHLYEPSKRRNDLKKMDILLLKEVNQNDRHNNPDHSERFI
jgi:hypothetical protein